MGKGTPTFLKLLSQILVVLSDAFFVFRRVSLGEPGVVHQAEQEKNHQQPWSNNRLTFHEILVV